MTALESKLEQLGNEAIIEMEDIDESDAKSDM